MGRRKKDKMKIQIKLLPIFMIAGVQSTNMCFVMTRGYEDCQVLCDMMDKCGAWTYYNPYCKSCDYGIWDLLNASMYLPVIEKQHYTRYDYAKCQCFFGLKKSLTNC